MRGQAEAYGDDPAEFEKMLDELLALEEGLTPWEVRFIEDMDRKRALHGRGSFTRDQRNKVEEVWNRRIG